MAKLERAMELAILWKNECYNSNQVIFRKKYNLVDYGTMQNVAWPKEDYEIPSSCDSIKRSKKMVVFLKDLISSLNEDDEYLISLFGIYKRNKEVSELPTIYVVGTGHWSRSEKGEGLNAEGLLYSRALYAGKYSHWFEVTGEVDLYEDNNRGPHIKRFCESVNFFSSEEEMLKKVLSNSYAEESMINSSNIFVRVKSENKGRFIGIGGCNIKRLETICKKRIFIKDRF